MSRGLLLADAQLNVAPNLAAKRDIVLNTIQLAISLGLAAPNVALLAAMDGPATAFPSTTDAVALKIDGGAKGMFRGAIVDGPLTPDSALSGDAARTNGVTSEVAGRVDVLIAPSMESALMVLRTLMAFNAGLAAGIVLGARSSHRHSRAQRLDGGADGVVRACLARRFCRRRGGGGAGGRRQLDRRRGQFQSRCVTTSGSPRAGQANRPGLSCRQHVVSCAFRRAAGSQHTTTPARRAHRADGDRFARGGWPAPR